MKFKLFSLPQDLFTHIFSFCDRDITESCFYACMYTDNLLNLHLLSHVSALYDQMYNKALREASVYGCLHIVKYLISLGADMYAEDCGGENAIIISAEYGNIKVLRYLVSIGADIHVNDEYALRWASGNGHLDVVRYLVSLDANIHINDDEPITWASENGNREIVDYFNSFEDL